MTPDSPAPAPAPVSSPMLRRARLVPLIVACALFMENLDATIISTALPAIARDLNEDPLHLSLAITSYLLSLAIFIPLSGWMADRYGARTVFRNAILVFVLGSLGCAAAQGIAQKLDPGPPVEGNGYEQAGERTLPGSWRRAIMAAERSQFLRDALGAEFMKIFLAIKLQECTRFSAEVSELDYAWYLRS